MDIVERLKKIVSLEGPEIKRELEEELAERCIHRHTKETHPNCFRKGLTKKLLNTHRWYEEEDYVMGFFDIETTGFKANKGFMLSWAIKLRDGDTLHDVIKPSEIRNGTFDERIVGSMLDAFHNLDILVTYYGTRFDIPYARTRAIANDLIFPGYGSIYHFDVYYRARRLLKLHNNKMGSVERFIGKEQKNHVHIDDWFRAQYGDQEAIDYVIDHNIRDVAILEDVFDVIEPYSKWTRKSI